MTAPPAACAVSVGPGGTTGACGGAMLPPLQNAAIAAQPAGTCLAASAAAPASRRCSSLGSATQASAAWIAAASTGDKSSPATNRTQRQAHSTAERFVKE